MGSCCIDRAGIILTNQVIGPIGAKHLIKYAQEDGKGTNMSTPTLVLV